MAKSGELGLYTQELRPWEANYRLYKMANSGELAKAIVERFELVDLGRLNERVIIVRSSNVDISMISEFSGMPRKHQKLKSESQLRFDNGWIHIKATGAKKALGLSLMVNNGSIYVRKWAGGFNDDMINFDKTDYFIIFASLEHKKPSLTIKKSSQELMMQYGLLFQ